MTAFLLALATSAVLAGIAVPVLRRAQFMDVPNHRSSHVRPVPRGGGVAVVATLLLVVAVTPEASVGDPQVQVMLGVTALLAAVGLVDDVKSLPSSVRLLAQVAAAGALSALLLRHGVVSWWWLPVLVVVVVGYVNAFNFMDGVNGISSLTAVVIGGWWAWAGHDQGHEVLQVLGLALAGAALGFLPWNAPQAKVFLGDVGSYGLGVFAVGLSALALTDGLPWQWALAPLVIYCADTGWVLLKRKHGGRPLTQPHREHVYQRLVDAGWSHLPSAALCAGAGLLVCLVTGVAGEALTWWAVAAVLVIVLAYLNAARTLVGAPQPAVSRGRS